jgi:serine/threonine protein kinase
MKIFITFLMAGFGEPRTKIAWLASNVGDQFSNIKRLGSSTSNSIVVSALRLSDGIPVALKYVQGENGQKEADLLIQNQHPTIVRLIDQFPLAGGHCLVLPLAPHGNLLSYIRCWRGMFFRDDSGELFRKIVYQMIQSVEFLHSRGLIHNDIKLENFVVFGTQTEPIIQLIDLGTADSGNDGRMGTLEYASPEKFSGDPITTKTDIWSLGVSVFLALTGQRPFSAPTSSNLVQRQRIVCKKVKAAKVAFEKRLWVDFPQVEAIVKSMIVADPNLRKSAVEILDDSWFDPLRT